MVASAIHILDSRGKVLISRDYRGEVPMSAADEFASRLAELEERDEIPIYTDADGVTFAYSRHDSLLLLSTTRRNANMGMMLLFHVHVCRVLTSYFGELNEEAIRDNFVIIYELLDELMDFGYPQSTEEKILKEYITQEGYRSETGPAPKPPVALTNAVSWRSEGIVHRKNEIFLDVVERLSLLVSSTGQVLRSEIHGTLFMKSYLSGMPDLRLGLNDKLMLSAAGKSAGKGKAVEMEDVKFHQCVRLSRFETDRTISFIPPDGAFELMSYRLNTTVKPLIWAEINFETQTRSRLEFLVKVRSQFKSRSTANNVEIVIPVPEDVDTPSFKASVGSVTYVPDKDVIIWSIKSFYGGREHTLKAHFGLPSTSKSGESDAWKSRNIECRFEIPYFTVSSLSIRYLRIVEKSGYQALPWVRYITTAQPGDYLLRMKG
jgi:AP-1 complex subunit mu